MAIKVRLTNKSNPTKSSVHGVNGSTPDIENNIDMIMSRSIYQRLGSLVANRTLLSDYESGNLPQEYVEFLDEMEKLFVNDGSVQIKDEYIAIDEYLGELGIIYEYHYSKDFVNIPQWMDFQGDQSEYRIVTDSTDNTYLVDPVDGSVLVSYTGVENG